MESLYTRKGSKQTRRQFIQQIGLGAGAAALPISSGLLRGMEDYPDRLQLLAAHRKKGMIPPNRTYRMMEWEFHTPPQANFDINVEAAIQASAAAGAESVLFYIQDCWGYAFYPTRVGVRNPGLSYDLFGKEVELAHQHDIAVTSYYSTQFNNQIVLNHPDWAWVNERGEPQKFRWYVPCLDTPYRQYVLGMLDEVCSRYKVEELFLDVFGIQFWQYHSEGLNPFCFCKYTEEAWNREHSGDPYRAGFATREGWEQRYAWHQKRTMYDMLDSIIAAARKHQPDLAIALNGGPEQFPNGILEKASFIYNEPVTTTTGISLGSILSRGWGSPHYQAGVFTTFGYIDKYPGSVSRVQADALIVQNARTFFVGNAPIVGGLNAQGFSNRWFQVAKETWSDVRNIDCLLGPQLQPLLNCGVFYSEPTRDELDALKVPLDFRHSVLGALETLTYAGRPVESIPEFRLTEGLLAQFELFVLPEVDVLSDYEVELLRNWVKGGGTLISSFKCGLLDQNGKSRNNFPLADVFGVDYHGEEKKYAYDRDGKPRPDFASTYLESSGHPLAKVLTGDTVGLPGGFLYLKQRQGEEVMHYRLPFMVEDLAANKWFNWGPPPPGPKTAGPAVILNRFGKGQSMYIGVPIFRAMSTRFGWGTIDRPFWIREWIRTLVKDLVRNPSVELETQPFTEYVHGTFFYTENKHYLLVQVLNAIELAAKGEYRGTANVTLQIDPHKLRVKGAKVIWPTEQILPVTVRSRSLRVKLPPVDGYMALYLKLA